MAETADPDRPALKPWLTSLAVMVGTFMVVLDSTIVNVSLPHIAGNLSASYEEATWALTTYLAANAVTLPITGWLASYVGRKRLLLLAIAAFTAASMLCGTAPSLEALVIWRAVQGMSGGVMQPLSQAIMLEAFPPRARGKAMAFWGLGIVVAPILGPVLGGWLTDRFTWRSVFYVNLPVGLVALAMIRQFVADPAYIRQARASIDTVGISLLAIAVASLQIGLDRGQQEDWFSSRWITALLVTAAVGLIAFVVHGLRARAPVVQLRVFRDRTFAVGSLLVGIQGFGLFGSLVLLPVMLQTLLGYPALDAGVAMAPRGIGSLLIMPLVGVALARLDARKVVGTGLLVFAATLYWMSTLDLTVGYWDIFWPQLFQGVGLGMLFVPLTTVTMDRIPKEQMGNATSLFNLVRNIGSSVGIAITQTVLARTRQASVNDLVTHVHPFSAETREMVTALRSAYISAGADATTATERAYAAIWGMVQQQAAILSFLHAFRLLAIGFVLVLPLVLLLRRPEHQKPLAAAAD